MIKKLFSQFVTHVKENKEKEFRTFATTREDMDESVDKEEFEAFLKEQEEELEALRKGSKSE